MQLVLNKLFELFGLAGPVHPDAPASEPAGKAGPHAYGVYSQIVRPVEFKDLSESVEQLGMYWVLLNQFQPPSNAQTAKPSCDSIGFTGTETLSPDCLALKNIGAGRGWEWRKVSVTSTGNSS